MRWLCKLYTKFGNDLDPWHADKVHNRLTNSKEERMETALYAPPKENRLPC